MLDNKSNPMPIDKSSKLIRPISEKLQAVMMSQKICHALAKEAFFFVIIVGKKAKEAKN